MTETIDNINTQEAPPPITLAPPEARTIIDSVLEEVRADLDEACTAAGVPRASFELAVRHAARKAPGLEACTRSSLAIAILDLARLGFLPAGLDGQAALFAVEKDGELEAKAQAMVNGLVGKALDAGVLEIDANTVREGEAFRYEPTTKTLEHQLLWPRPPKIVAAYAWADMADGRRLYEVIDKADIDAARAAAHGNPAWNTHPGAMAEKTARKRLVMRRRLLPAATIARLGEMLIEGDPVAPVAPPVVPQVVSAPVDVAPAASEGAGPAAPASAIPPMSDKTRALLEKARAAKAHAAGVTAAAAPPAPPSSPPRSPKRPAPKKAAAPAKGGKKR